MSMFCYQCEQTVGGAGCTKVGVCGKTPEAAALQDVMVHLCKGIARYGHRARGLGASDREVDVYLLEALFTTVTNVNFDTARLEQLIRTGEAMLDKIKALYEQACADAGHVPEQLGCPAGGQLAADAAGLVEQARMIAIPKRVAELGEDVTGLQELLLYGLKGMAAYADHAKILGHEDEEVYAYFHEALDFLTSDDATDLGKLVPAVLRCGEINLKAMGLLDAANTGTYGHPEPTAVRVTPGQATSPHVKMRSW